MIDWKWCSECRNFHGDKHLPQFLCWDLTNESSEDDGVNIRAINSKCAAELFVEEWDAQGDYECITGSPMNVAVKDEKGVITEYTVTGETVPNYTARFVQ